MRSLRAAGAQKIAIGEAEELQRRGLPYELIFLTASKEGEQYLPLLSGLRARILESRSSLSAAGVLSYFVTRLFGPLSSYESRVDIASLARGLRYVSAKAPDILLCHDQYAGLIGLALSRLRGLRYWVFVHEKTAGEARFASLIQRLLGAIIDREVLSNADYIFANTGSTLRSVKRLVGSGFDRVSVNYYPALRAGTPSSSADVAVRSPFTILSVSTWERGRNPGWYIEVAKRLSKAKLVIAGMWKDVSLLQECRHSVQKEGLTNRVEIVGAVSEDELDRSYRSSAVFLRVGDREMGPGMGILEAISYGLPIVTNRGLGAVEIVEGTGCAVVFDAETPNLIDPSEVARVLDELVSDESRRAAMAGRARELATSLTWRGHVDRMFGPTGVMPSFAKP